MLGLGPVLACAQTLNFQPFLVRPSPQVTYVDEGGYFPPAPDGRTNFIRIFPQGLNYGDRVRLRTVGTYAVRQPGEEEFGAEAPQSFLGLMTGVPLRPNQYYLPAQRPDTGLPQYVTPPIERGGDTVPTDIENDFLITPGGVTLPCVPLEGNFFVFLNPDPTVAAKDAEQDFAIEITLLEGARLSTRPSLDRTNVTVGESVTLTLTLTNWGNVPVQGIEMYELRGPGTDIEHNTNLVRRVSGPTPRGYPSLAPGASAEIQYVYRTIGPGTNTWFSRVGRTVCGDQFYQASGGAIDTLVIKPLIEITPRRPTLAHFSEESLDAGNDDTEAPLEFSDDEATLIGAPEFAGRGLIADGVTPMLIRLEIAPDQLDRFETETTLRLEAILVSGEIAGTPVQDRLSVLKESGWSPDRQLIVSKDRPVAHAMLAAVAADELPLSDSGGEVLVRINVRDESDLVLGTIQIAIRRPPIALIHGYNTNGDWGGEFIRELAESRTAPFIRIARYGQDEIESEVTGRQAARNTLWPLANLAPLAERALAEAMEPVRAEWLFTRYDVVAHSQGGLLTRMLCSRTPNRHVPLPFRNEENYFRGRFHRVITIGSPHNGTRLLRYLLKLNEIDGPAIPGWVGFGMVESNTAQQKFDPWGEQIRALNDPAPSSPWAPDPAAMFHLVRTVVLGGQNFTPTFWDCPAYWALGIDNPTAGQIVAPQGSDGVVDFASMYAGADVLATGYSVPAENRISHAYYEVATQNFGEIFGATSGQVLSPLVARHAIGALDQDPSLPASERFFGSFQVPPLLDDATRDAIDALAASYDLDVGESEYTRLSPLSTAGLPVRSHPSTATRTFALRLVAPAGYPVGTQGIYWVASLYGTNGITRAGVAVLPSGTDPLEVRVRVDPGAYGDLVLEGMFESANGSRVTLTPYLVESIVPAGITAQSLEIYPGDQSRHPSGLEIPIEIWTEWSDGTRTRRFANSTTLEVSSSDPTIVDTSNPLRWRTQSPGETVITTSFEGKTYPAQWTVFDPAEGAPPMVPIAIELTAGSNVAVSWPGAAGSGFQLQSSERLGPDANWLDAPESPTQSGDLLRVEFPVSSGTRFYRLEMRP
jgi:uncharacterized repeat protein (TIGR01451 family)